MTGPDDAPQRPDYNSEENPMTTTTPIDGGATAVECTTCDWTIPGEQHEGHGTRERPGGADWFDAALPDISAHLDSTGHPVRVTTTTSHADGLVEQSAQIITPRTTPKETLR